jgi:hypothetical protein
MPFDTTLKNRRRASQCLPDSQFQIKAREGSGHVMPHDAGKGRRASRRQPSRRRTRFNFLRRLANGCNSTRCYQTDTKRRDANTKFSMKPRGASERNRTRLVAKRRRASRRLEKIANMADMNLTQPNPPQPNQN